MRFMISGRWPAASLFITLVVATIGCPSGSQGPSRVRITKIEYKPDDTNAARRDVTFTYFESGFLDKVEIEVDGEETDEILYSFEDGVFVGQESTSKSEFSSTTVKQTLVWENGRVTKRTSDTDGRSEFSDGDVILRTGEGETTYTYDDQGNLTGWEQESKSTRTQESEFDGFTTEYRDESSSDGKFTLTWNDSGLLTKIETESESESKSYTDDVLDEGDPSRSESSSEAEFTYDEGKLTKLETDNRFKFGTDDEESRSEGEIEVELNDDGQVVEISITSQSGTSESEQEIEVSYDDNGVVTRIEDDEGNRWEIEYAEGEEVKGVTIFPQALLFFDAEGQQDFGFFTSQTHLAF